MAPGIRNICVNIPAWPVKPQFSHLKNGMLSVSQLAVKAEMGAFEIPGTPRRHSVNNSYSPTTNYYYIPQLQSDVAHDIPTSAHMAVLGMVPSFSPVISAR